MKFTCLNPGCNNSQEVPQQVPDAALEAIEDVYGWMFVNGTLLCHDCACHDKEN